MPNGVRIKSIADLRMRCLETNAGCWEWQMSRGPQGYGWVAQHIYGVKLAHRLAYLLASGDPADACVLHRCDNPPCCNPAHLFLGTRIDNMEDARAKGRAILHGKRGEKNWNSHLTDEQAATIRGLRGLESKAALCARFGVSENVVEGVLYGKTYRQVGQLAVAARPIS